MLVNKYVAKQLVLVNKQQYTFEWWPPEPMCVYECDIDPENVRGYSNRIRICPG